LWWPNGKPRVEAELKEGQPHGRFRAWHQDGELFREGAHAQGRRAGRWVSRNGAERSSAWYDPNCAIVSRVVAGGPAHQAGVRTGDRVRALGGTPVGPDRTLGDLVQASGDRPIVLTVERESKRLSLEVRPALMGGRARIGVELDCRRDDPPPQ